MQTLTHPHPTGRTRPRGSRSSASPVSFRLPILLLLLLGALAALPGAAAPQGPESADGWQTQDEEWAALADRIPGFAGWALGADGVLEVRLAPVGRSTPTPEADPRRQALDQTFGADHRVIPAQFDFRSLYDWKLEARGLVGPEHRTFFVDIDETQNRLVLGIDRSAPRAAFRGLEQALVARGIPRDAIVLEPVEEPRNFLNLRDRVNPSPGGVEVLVGGICTLGVNVRRSNPSDPSGSGYDTGFVTAGHCTDFAGTVAYQPAGTGSTRVGVVKAYGAAVSPPSCPPGEICKYADVLFVDYDTLSYADLGKIARSNATFPFPILSRSTITTVLSNPTGGTIRKTGRTTGETTTTVRRSCVDAKFGGDRFYFLCLNTVNGGGGSFSAPGDSGAPLYTDKGSGTVQLHGLLKGGSSSEIWYSPWSNVQADLGTLLLF